MRDQSRLAESDRTWGRSVAASTETYRAGRHRPASPPERPRTRTGHRRLKLATLFAATAAAMAVVIVFALQYVGKQEKVLPPETRQHVHDPGFALSARPGSYIGLYPNGVPDSYDGITEFTAATGVRPNVVPYYSGWLEPFQETFAVTAAQHGAVPLVQMDPTDISLAAIASGQYDGYLKTYADAVRAYDHPVIFSFGHEMNGGWYSWGYRHTPAAVFVAAWRHIVNLFRAFGAKNVTWLWTVNVLHPHHRIRVPSPVSWWPGSSYVTWVGIDGYYFNSSFTFASLFGPTIAAVRELTKAPILIAETAASRTAGQPAKIADLFAGVRLYGLLGFVWFDSIHLEDWRISSPAAIAAFRRGAVTPGRPAS
jgi:mannan endo-1,4-beta-mannosidase